MSNLDGRWWIYRCSVYGNVLKGPETQLVIAEQENGDLASRFELSGRSRRVEVKMRAGEVVKDALGEQDTFDFRLVALEKSGTTVLSGYAVDKVGVKHADVFTAVKTKRTIPLPAADSYTFGCSHITPMDANMTSEAGSKVVVDLKGEKIFFRDDVFPIDETSPYEGGLKVAGSYFKKDEREAAAIKIWILPVDSTGLLLATGSWSYNHEAISPIELLPYRPFDPLCTNGLYLCQDL